MSKIIFRADDLGFSEGVNCGIYKAIKDGLVRSTAIMVNMPSAKSGYDMVKDLDCAIGQHTNICAGRPVSDPSLIPSLVQPNGEFCTSKEIRARTEDKVDLHEAEIEVEAQYFRFREITGRDPDYFECHAIGNSPNFLQAIKNIAKKYNLNYEMVGEMAYEEARDVHSINYVKLDERGLYDPKQFLIDNLDRIKSLNCTCMVLHPGFLDWDILNHSSYTLIRPMECDFVCSQWLKDFVKENELEVTDFRKV